MRQRIAGRRRRKLDTSPAVAARQTSICRPPLHGPPRIAREVWRARMGFAVPGPAAIAPASFRALARDQVKLAKGAPFAQAFSCAAAKEILLKISHFEMTSTMRKAEWRAVRHSVLHCVAQEPGRAVSFLQAYEIAGQVAGGRARTGPVKILPQWKPLPRRTPPRSVNVRPATVRHGRSLHCLQLVETRCRGMH